jgi:hypothetical protein
MAANADDLRDFYATDLGDSVAVSASVAAAQVSLAPGRYLVRYRSIAGAATIWARQGSAAAAAIPSTPYDVALFNASSGYLFTTNVRGSGAKQVLSFILDAGTAQIIVTRISR